ncbi:MULTISPECIES: M15 family metallopeptidase [unclassified Romboutsia]|uniref:M15 family metallopeptidase n=1 Tax=unclassified Romboutsia TaxID=2626894 RepID=UPI00082218C8|nr:MULTISPECIES: M15 family metallopeptidase [unclassified Romboutsia]SCH04483.1 D-alanyl-D-alanine carboxypeptidase [uncultured Clostridium sp.]
MKKVFGVLSIISIVFIGANFISNKADYRIEAESKSSKYIDISKKVNDESNDIKITQEYIEGVQALFVNDIVVVNKEFGLPKDYRAPKELEVEALNAAENMIKDALKEGIIINIKSGYRSYKTQEALHDYYVKRDGSKAAKRYSATPGHSEHQTGLAFDFTTSNTRKSIGTWFTDTQQAKWLYENAYKYGFIIRYPQGKEDITGYQYESWHYRYVGYEHSKNFVMNNLTLEEYLGLD